MKYTNYMQEPVSTSVMIFHGLLAIFGALTHAAKAHRAGTVKSPLDFFTLMAMSSFAGVMFALIGFHLFPDQLYLSAALAGTGGYLGTEGMTMIVIKIQEILTKK